MPRLVPVINTCRGAIGSFPRERADVGDQGLDVSERAALLRDCPLVAQDDVAANRLQPLFDVEQQPDEPERIERAVRPEDRRAGGHDKLAGGVARLIGRAHRPEYYLLNLVVADRHGAGPFTGKCYGHSWLSSAVMARASTEATCI